MANDYSIGVITNDIYIKGGRTVSREEQRPSGGTHHRRGDRRLPAHRDPRGCFDEPRGRRRDDGAVPGTSSFSLSRAAGDNLSATFSPELVDATIFVIDVAEGDKIPRKGGPGITRSDLLVINKIDLAPYVGASLEVMEHDSKKMRGERPFLFTNIRGDVHVDDVVSWIKENVLLEGM